MLCLTCFICGLLKKRHHLTRHIDKHADQNRDSGRLREKQTVQLPQLPQKTTFRHYWMYLHLFKAVGTIKVDSWLVAKLLMFALVKEQNECMW